MIEGLRLRLLASGDAEERIPELATLAPRYASLLYRLAYSVLRNTAEAEDVVQETFLRVARRQETLDGIADMQAWLSRIAWNLALDRRRKVVPEQMDEVFAADLRATGLSAEEALEQAGRMATVMEEIAKLPKQERMALELSAVEELSAAEIGEILQRSEASVRGLVYRARAHLKAGLEKRERMERRRRG